MVLIKDVVREQSEGEKKEIQERLPEKLARLSELSSSADSVKKLKSIESAVDRLLRGKKEVSEELIRQRKEKRKRHYMDHKEEILTKQKARRFELRQIARNATPVEERREKSKGEWDLFQEKALSS